MDNRIFSLENILIKYVEGRRYVTIKISSRGKIIVLQNELKSKNIMNGKVDSDVNIRIG